MGEEAVLPAEGAEEVVDTAVKRGIIKLKRNEEL